MVKLNEILDFINALAPQSLSESYDNVGLLVGNHEKEIKSVLITLDTDESVVNEAKEKNADLVISHHPIIFKPLSRITDKDSTQRAVISLIKNDIAQISVHTNFDSVEKGLCDLFLDKIADTQNRTVLEGAEPDGLGRFAYLKAPLKLIDILKSIKENFKLSTVRFVGNEESKISKIAVCNGGGAEFVEKAKEMGADCFISGDIKYHQARYAYENDIAFIEIPHYNAEVIFSEYMKEILEEKFGQKIKILVSDKNIDIWKHF